MRKLLLVILDGVPYANWRRLFGNLEGWVQSGEARVWKMRAVLRKRAAIILIAGQTLNRHCLFWGATTTPR